MTFPSEEEWMKTFRDTLTPLYEYACRRAGGKRELAEDVTQEAWLRAVDAWRRSGFPDEPLAWLKTVTRNLLWNFYRKTPSAGAQRIAVDLEAKDAGSQSHEAAALIQWGLSRLSRPKARLLEGFYFEEKDTRTISHEMRLSERAVEGRLRRCRSALRRHLRPFILDEANHEERPTRP